MVGYLKNQGTHFIFFRLGLIFVFVAIATIINRKNVSFISKLEPIAVSVITALLIFDYYVTHLSGSQFLYRVWWIISIFVAELTLFFTLSVIKCDDYKLFYKSFWWGFTPLYLFTLIICFLRNPFGVRTVNTQLFNGTFLMLKAFINNPSGSFEAPLIFFGNVFVFVPLSFILFNSFKRIKPYQVIIVGIIAPIVVEGYQYILSCGDVDIDDLILNWFGFFIGMLIQRIINKKRLDAFS
jgi:glycopeptide antibiotics resistance protein